MNALVRFANTKRPLPRIYILVGLLVAGYMFMNLTLWRTKPKPSDDVSNGVDSALNTIAKPNQGLRDWELIKAKSSKDQTMLVSIGSYRDIRCPVTLISLHNNAKYAGRVFVGLIQQNHEDDVDCVEQALKDESSPAFKEWVTGHVRVIRMSYLDGKGPCVARAQIVNKLYLSEDWIFQVDSHTRFVPEWDDVLLNDINGLPPKSCLSIYPLSDDIDNAEIPDAHVENQRICRGEFNHEKVMQPGGVRYSYRDHPKTVQGRAIPFMAAGMMIYPGYATKEVPWDENLIYLFQGEEVLFSMRMTVKGYKFYAPAENICFHYYGRADKPKVWDKQAFDKTYVQEMNWSVQRLKYIVGQISIDKVDNPDYTLRQIEKYGINFEDPVQLENYNKFLYRWRPLSFKDQVDFNYCSKEPNPDNEVIPKNYF
ncbi:hydroxyproline N-acetylglucosaminyltransferase [Acrasis kona]|uniref:Hydroxyproline N-acetylglucosaminyltransferase n=1 Tax=Acrasis kona TaxID=1008807 RepID=A0AAW2ZL28_9EUKA